jgi:hypothetical protein
MMKRIPAIAIVASLALTPAAAIAQANVSPKVLFEGNLAAPQKDAAPTGQASVKSWEFFNKNGAVQELPLAGFYVAHLVSGKVAATIDGQTTNYQPGSYWTVKAGAKMQVKVLGEMAVLETITASKQ